MSARPDPPVAVWEEELRRHNLGYPDDRLVALLRRRHPQVEPPGSLRALDVGFGSGRHVALLMDLGFRTDGVELIQQAVDDIRTRLGAHPMAGEFVVGDLATVPLQPATYDVIVAWGVVFLRPWDDMAGDLARLTSLLRPGGSLLVNFRREASYFSDLGSPVGGSIRLDERAGSRAGALYTFCEPDQAEELLEGAGLVVADREELQLVKGPERHVHSWVLYRAERPADAPAEASATV